MNLDKFLISRYYSRILGPIIWLAFVLCISGTPLHAWTVDLPDDQRLRARLSEFHNALGDNDIVTWYNITAPAIRKRMTLDEFKQGFRWDDTKPRVRSTINAQLVKPCSCVKTGLTRCVILVDINTTEPGKTPVNEKSLQSWDYFDGEWYWGYMGPGNKGGCPGEK
jgi:hypothetical protein